MCLLRKGYVPMAGYVAERGGYGPPPLHFAKASFRSELRRNEDVAPHSRPPDSRPLDSRPLVAYPLPFTQHRL